MASGDVVGIISAITPPTANYATLDERAGGSTPAESFVVWDFDADAVEYLDVHGHLSGYDAGGLTVKLRWAASSATTGAVVWEAAIRRIADDAEDVDAAHTYVFNTATATTASASGEFDYASVAFTDGADMDSLADTESFVLRVARLATDGSDTMTGDAELVQVIITET